MILYNALNFLFYILTVLCVFCLVLEYELRIQKQSLVLAITGFAILASMCSFFFGEHWDFYINGGLVLIFLLLYSKCKKRNIIGVFLIITVSLLQLTLSLNLIFSSIVFMFDSNFKNIPLLNLTTSIVLFLIVAVITKRIWEKGTLGRDIKIHDRKWFIAIQCIIFGVNTLLLLSVFRMLTTMTDTIENTVTIVFYLFIPFSFVLVGFIAYYFLITHERQKQLLSLNDRYLKQLNVYCDSLISQNNELRKIRHDVRQHLYSINLLLENDKIEDTKKYVQQFIEKTGEFLPVSKSGNLVIDAIIRQYTPIATKNNISIILSGQMPKHLSISNYDLCTIIYNLLINAIEECMKIKGHKEILIRIGSYGRYINLSMTNPLYAPKKTFHISGKQDKTGHGYGLKNVEQCVKDNHGDIKITSNNTECKIDIVMEGILKAD